MEEIVRNLKDLYNSGAKVVGQFHKGGNSQECSVPDADKRGDEDGYG